MALYRASGKTLATTANANIIELRAPSTRRIEVREVSIVAEAATATFIALFKTTAVGTAGTAVTGQAVDPKVGAASSTLVTAPTGGTNSTVAVGRWHFAAVGAAAVWEWPAHEPMIIDPGLSFVVRSDGTLGASITWNIAWDE